MFKLPAGKYYIGDPCYVFADATWQKLLDDVDDFLDGEIKHVSGFDLWAHSTAWGDGTYADQNGIEYGVDSGSLGAVPIGMVDNVDGLEHGTVMDFPNGLTVEYDNGTFWFGSIVIKTDDADEDEFEDAYDGDPEDDRFV
jgi:hypothetical protein